ncbi:unnamed protein product [Schistosoma turkestanicum]|nr:unnamed protein product [Schistosoma turkestanicum]
MLLDALFSCFLRRSSSLDSIKIHDRCAREIVLREIALSQELRRVAQEIMDSSGLRKRHQHPHCRNISMLQADKNHIRVKLEGPNDSLDSSRANRQRNTDPVQGERTRMQCCHASVPSSFLAETPPCPRLLRCISTDSVKKASSTSRKTKPATFDKQKTMTTSAVSTPIIRTATFSANDQDEHPVLHSSSFRTGRSPKPDIESSNEDIRKHHITSEIHTRELTDSQTKLDEHCPPNSGQVSQSTSGKQITDQSSVARTTPSRGRPKPSAAATYSASSASSNAPTNVTVNQQNQRPISQSSSFHSGRSPKPDCESANEDVLKRAISREINTRELAESQTNVDELIVDGPKGSANGNKGAVFVTIQKITFSNCHGMKNYLGMKNTLLTTL